MKQKIRKNIHYCWLRLVEIWSVTYIVNCGEIWSVWPGHHRNALSHPILQQSVAWVMGWLMNIIWYKNLSKFGSPNMLLIFIFHNSIFAQKEYMEYAILKICRECWRIACLWILNFLNSILFKYVWLRYWSLQTWA